MEFYPKEPDVAEETELNSKKTKDATWRGYVEHFADDTSIHGIKKTADTNKSRASRLVWVVLGVLAIGSLVNLMVLLFGSYFLYPFKTSLMISPTDQLPFPAVTICNLNSLESSKLQALDTELFNVSRAVMALSLVSSLFTGHVNDTFALVENRIPQEVLNQTFQEVTRKAFSSLNETFISCFWDGEEESCDAIFTSVDTDQRRCFLFNGHVGQQAAAGWRRRRSHHSGLSSGLQVVLNVRQEDYVFSDNLAAGFQIILHEPGEMPDINNRGFLVSPGFTTNAKVDFMKYQYLPAPFKAFGKKECKTEVPLASQIRKGTNYSYSFPLCRKICADLAAQKACGCRLSDTSFAHDRSLPLCTIREVYSCYKQLSTILAGSGKSSECDCPRKCDKTEYDVVTSFAYFPSDVTLQVFNKIQLVDNTSSSRKNFANLKIFYEDLLFHEVSHVPEYTINSILGTVGGQMGLFLGASLLSIMEVLELLCGLCYRAARAVFRRQWVESSSGH